jgi:hypothetical protein
LLPFGERGDPLLDERREIGDVGDVGGDHMSEESGDVGEAAIFF